MKLWELYPVEDWKPWYDRAFGFVVRAETELEARKLAAGDAGNEGSDVWLNEKLTSCDELFIEGDHEIVIRDLRRA